MQPRPVLIMAGGTGGHVYPALAVADYLQDKGIPLFWLGTPGGMEARVVPTHGYELLTLNIRGLRGKGLLRWLLAPWSVLAATIRALQLLRNCQPAVVLGMGGFVSGPGGLAAWLLRIPLCIHEQNSVCGLTNRWLSHLAGRVIAAFPDVFPGNVPVTVTGNPVRAEIVALPSPQERQKSRNDDTFRILVLGGSQGALALNRIVPEALAGMSSSLNLEIHHQAGERHYEEAHHNYASIAHPVKVEAFIEDMAGAYARADMVICRAGALTIAELTVAGLPAIFIPYPHAVDDHQTVNARFMVNAGAAICIQEQQLDPKELQDVLAGFCRDRDRVLAMACKARALGRPHATAEVARICMEVAHGG